MVMMVVMVMVMMVMVMMISEDSDDDIILNRLRNFLFLLLRFIIL